MSIKFIDEASIKNKRVLARFDLNIPLDAENNCILDTTRIDHCLETIRYILDQGASKLIIMGHLGRPQGIREKKFSLLPVAKYLAEKLSTDITLTESATDSGIKTLLNLSTNRIILLENLRFHKEEKQNDKHFAHLLADYGDLYVNDAFGSSHRKHSSLHAINAYFPTTAYGGFLLKKEMIALNKIYKNPRKPFITISGGIKISDKIQILEKLLVQSDFLLVGGAMAYPFLKAKNISIGKSLCSSQDLQLAKNILHSFSASKLILPIDHIFSTTESGTPREGTEIPNDCIGLDIGHRTRSLFINKLLEAKTVFWNGPLGLCENPDYAVGTYEIAKSLTKINAFTVIGGGNSIAAIKKTQLESSISHISTGGGASFKFIEEGSLVAIDALKFGVPL